MTAWTQRDGTELKDWWNRYTVGQGWGSAQLVEGGDGPGSSAHMGIDHDGRAIAVGPQYDGERSNLSANRYTPGEGWHAAELIESDIAQRLGYVEFALHSNGNAIAVWSTFTNIWANHYEPDVGWGEAERIETNGKSARLPHVALDAHGNAVACRSSKRCPSRDVSRDDREGDPADGTRSRTCVADGSTCASRFAASALAPRSARSSPPTSCGIQSLARVARRV